MTTTAITEQNVRQYTLPGGAGEQPTDKTVIRSCRTFHPPTVESAASESELRLLPSHWRGDETGRSAPLNQSGKAAAA